MAWFYFRMKPQHKNDIWLVFFLNFGVLFINSSQSILKLKSQYVLKSNLFYAHA